MPHIIKYIYGGLTPLYPLINLIRYFGKDNPMRKMKFFLSFDCDYSKDIMCLSSLLSLLNKYKIRASFACVGYFIEKYPKEHKMIINDGHEILNHSFSHPSNQEINPDINFDELSSKEQEHEIKSTQEVCQIVLNYSPIGFRLPHFGNVKDINYYSLFTMLAKNRIKYDSSLLDFMRFPNKKKNLFIFQDPKTGITEFPITTCPYHPFTAFDSYHVFRSNRFIYRFGKCRKNLPKVFEKIIELNRRIKSEINIYLDPMDVSNNPEYESVFKLLSADTRIKFTTYRDYLKI